MDWLQSLLWDPSSVAHIVLLYAFVVAAGVYLGKIKIFGVSLGVTFVLFAGILMGHFGFTADTHILHFIREFGLILFVFCIGLQVGPSFFSSFPIRFSYPRTARPSARSTAADRTGARNTATSISGRPLVTMYR